MKTPQPRFMDANFQRTADFDAGTEEERACVVALERDGVAIIDPRIDDFDALAEELTRQTTRRLPGAGRLQDAWRTMEVVRRIATNAHVMRLLEFAYGRRPMPFQTLNFTRGTQQHTHSDTIHFDSFPHNFMCGVWVALEDADEGNGALHYYPGSHKLPAKSLEDFGIPAGGYFTRNNSNERYAQAMAEHIAETGLPKRVLPIRKGKALIWTANLFHGGEPIADPSRTRHSQVTHYYFEGGLYTQPLWSDLHGGRIMYKKVFDIARDRYVTPVYNGKPFRLPIESHLREFLVARVIRVRKSG